MKDKILLLRSQGKSYNEICKTLNCSKGLVSYYVDPKGKSKTLDRQNRNRFMRRKKYKMMLGGKCKKCGYDRCLESLHFHHREPSKKSFEIQSAIWGQISVTETQILQEIKKCDLVCANCHGEIHSHHYTK